MNPKPKFVPHIPRDVSLNPQFDTISVKMKDLFVQFVTKSSRQQLIKQLLDAAVSNSLVPGKFPNPLQTDPLPSFTNSGKNPMNAPPVGRRSARPALMSLTLGPTPRPHRPGTKEQAQQGAPTLMSTIDLSRSSQVIPPLNDLLTTVLEPAALSTKEATLVSLLGEVQPRDPSLIKPDVPVPAAFERVCRDVLGINPLFGRCLERKICDLTSPPGQAGVHPDLETQLLPPEQVPDGFRVDADPGPTVPQPGKLRGGRRRLSHQTLSPTWRTLPCSRGKTPSATGSVF